jgi:hypothetical protein
MGSIKVLSSNSPDWLNKWIIIKEMFAVKSGHLRNISDLIITMKYLYSHRNFKWKTPSEFIVQLNQYNLEVSNLKEPEKM